MTGIESEMEFAFAIAQLLCAPLIGNLGSLPGPQADALRVAFGHADRLAARIMTANRVSEVPALLVRAASRLGPREPSRGSQEELAAHSEHCAVGAVHGVRSTRRSPGARPWTPSWPR